MNQALRPRRIAIDGPAASGKSAAGTALARRLNFTFVDTGAIYRALTWLMLERHIEPSDLEAVSDLAASARFSIGQRPNGETGVVIDGRQATSHLREPAVEAEVSAVSAIPEVRRHLTEVQRRLADVDVVMAGRDIGSVVLPDADLKIFLDASPAERAKRRMAESEAAGNAEQYPDLASRLERRDLLDSNRSAAPLVVPDGAVQLNTDGLSLEDVIAQVLDLAYRRWPDLADRPETSRESRQRR